MDIEIVVADVFE